MPLSKTYSHNTPYCAKIFTTKIYELSTPCLTSSGEKTQNLTLLSISTPFLRLVAGFT